MGAFDNKDSGKMAIFLIVIVILIIFIISFLVGGVHGILGIIKFFIIFSMIVTFFGFVFYVIYYLFFKTHKKDVPHINWKSYLRSALDNGSDMMTDLVLMGDKNHSSKRFMTIKGYLRIMSFEGLQYDMFVGKRSSTNPFEDYKIVLLRTNEHSDLIGEVYVYGISLIIKFGYFFLNSEMLDYKGIDKMVEYDTYRTVMYETLGDLKGIMDRATGLNPDNIMEKQREKLLKIPMLTGQRQEP